MSEKKLCLSSKWKLMNYSERITVYEADLILYFILWAKQGNFVPTGNIVSEETVLLMPHQSQEFSMVLSAGQGCGKDKGLISAPSRTTTTSLGKSSPWKYSEIFRNCSFLLFNNRERLCISWDRSQSAHLRIIFNNAASLHSYCFSKANYGSSATQKWIIVIPTDCW